MSAQPLPGPQSLTPSPKTVSFAGALASANAILTSFATTVGASAITTFTGALGGAPGAGPVARSITATTSAHTGSYKTGAGNAIVVSGTDQSGNPIQDTIALTSANGGETVGTSKGFATITEIDVPGQNDALGTFTFGVQDVLVPYTRRIVVGTAGSLKVGFSLDGSVDTIGQKQITAEPAQDINASRVYGDSGTTAQDLTLYF